MLVNDALRYDSSKSKNAERRRNAEYLQVQMQEKMKKDGEEKSYFQSPCGYWGPEEKPVQMQELHRSLCSDLVKQMEVNQNRKLDSRGRRLKVERRLIDNCMAEISQDRDRDKAKAALHKEVLVTTWASQQKIKQAKNRVDDM